MSGGYGSVGIQRVSGATPQFLTKKNKFMSAISDNPESNLGAKTELEELVKNLGLFDIPVIFTIPEPLEAKEYKYNSATGFKEHENKTDYSEIDYAFITQMARRMNKNKGKYPKNNWKKPIDVEQLKQAMFRHVLSVMQGDYKDDGRDLGHLEAIALGAMMINYQLKYVK